MEMIAEGSFRSGDRLSLGRPSPAEFPIEAEPPQCCPPHAPRAVTPGRRQHCFVYGSWAQFWNPNRFPKWVPQTGPKTAPSKCPPTVGGHFFAAFLLPKTAPRTGTETGPVEPGSFPRRPALHRHDTRTLTGPRAAKRGTLSPSEPCCLHRWRLRATPRGSLRTPYTLSLIHI